MTQTLNPCRIPIPLPRTQRRNRAAIKVVTLRPSDEFIIHIGTMPQRLYFILSLYTDLSLRTTLYPQAIHFVFRYPIMPDTPGNPSFVAIAGRVYHHIRTDPHDDTAVRWILYDGFSDTGIPHRSQARDIPSSWIDAVRTSLIRHNPTDAPTLME